MLKTIFTSILCVLFFITGFAKDPQKNSKVEEAVRYKVSQNQLSLEVNLAKGVQTISKIQDNYLPTLLYGSNSQLEALGSRYAFAHSNSQLDELGSRYAFAH